MCHRCIFAVKKRIQYVVILLSCTVCMSTHQYSVKRWWSSSSLNMAEYCHSGIITQPLYHQLQTDMIAFQCIVGYLFSRHTDNRETMRGECFTNIWKETPLKNFTNHSFRLVNQQTSYPWCVTLSTKLGQISQYILCWYTVKVYPSFTADILILKWTALC